MRAPALAAALAISFAMPVASNTAHAEEKIKVSVPSNDITAFCMGIRIARHPNHADAIKKYNLDFETVAMPIPQVPLAVSTNDINVGECSGISTVFNAWNKGAKNVMIFAFGSALPVYQLVAAPAIKKLEDLKGKNIGIPGIQSAGAEAVEMILKRGANMLPDKDYQYVTVGAASATMAALVAGKIDAVPYFAPFTFELEKQGYSLLTDAVKYMPQYVTGTHVVSRDWATKNRDQFVRFLKAMIESDDWLFDPANEKQVVAWFADNIATGGANKMDAATAQRTYDFYVKDKRLARYGYAPESAVKANLDILKERGYITDAEIPTLGQVIDFSLLNQALKDLGKPAVQEYAK